MTLDWRALAPHRPIEIGDERYVPRVNAGGDEVARWIEGGEQTVLVAGPAGIGKSTELARAAMIVEAMGETALILPLDRYINVRSLTAEQLYLATARLIIEQTQRTKAPQLANILGAVVDLFASPGDRDPFDHAVAAIREAGRQSKQNKVVLFYDGLEKTLPESGRMALAALSTLAAEARLVVTAPWHAIYGPDADFVIDGNERMVALRPLNTDHKEGRQFLVDILLRRLGLVSLPDHVLEVVISAARWSGGIPRTFLQLVSDAATRARLSDGTDWPTHASLKDAVSSAIDATRRLLLPNDTAALLAVDGTDGREMPLDRKLRLLSHGILLEQWEGAPVMRPHPLVQPLLHA